MCPTEEIPKLITFNKYFKEMLLGDDSKFSMVMWNVYTEADKRTNNHVMMEFQVRESGRETPSQHLDSNSMVAKHDAGVPPPYNKNN